MKVSEQVAQLEEKIEQQARAASHLRVSRPVKCVSIDSINEHGMAKAWVVTFVVHSPANDYWTPHQATTLAIGFGIDKPKYEVGKFYQLELIG